MRSSSPDKVEFQPDHLNPSVAELRNPKVELLYNFFRQMAETNNANLIRNVDYLLASPKEDYDYDNSKIAWVCPSKQRFESTKFKLTD